MDILSATIVDATLTVSNSGNSRILTKTNFDDLCFSKSVDGASPTLALRCAGGTPIADGTVDFSDLSSSQARYFRLSLTNIFITSGNQSADESEARENICLSPQIYSWNYTHYRTNTGLPDTYVFSRWDIQTNSGTIGTNNPAFVSTGIRKTNGIELRWSATAGRLYRIFAVPQRSSLFLFPSPNSRASRRSSCFAFVHVHARHVLPWSRDVHDRALLIQQFDEAELWRRKWLAVVKERSGTESVPYATELVTLGLSLLRQDKWIDAVPDPCERHVSGWTRCPSPLFVDCGPGRRSRTIPARHSFGRNRRQFRFDFAVFPRLPSPQRGIVQQVVFQLAGVRSRRRFILVVHTRVSRPSLPNLTRPEMASGVILRVQPRS